jgi:hypothetical protein
VPPARRAKDLQLAASRCRRSASARNEVAVMGVLIGRASNAAETAESSRVLADEWPTSVAGEVRVAQTARQHWPNRPATVRFHSKRAQRGRPAGRSAAALADHRRGGWRPAQPHVRRRERVRPPTRGRARRPTRAPLGLLASLTSGGGQRPGPPRVQVGRPRARPRLRPSLRALDRSGRLSGSDRSCRCDLKQPKRRAKLIGAGSSCFVQTFPCGHHLESRATCSLRKPITAPKVASALAGVRRERRSPPRSGSPKRGTQQP